MTLTTHNNLAEAKCLKFNFRHYITSVPGHHRLSGEAVVSRCPRLEVGGPEVFGADARSVDALERTRDGEPGAVAELASALAWYARRDQAFAQELAAWAAQAGTGGVTSRSTRAGTPTSRAGTRRSPTTGGPAS
jgi:hypothetical protein